MVTPSTKFSGLKTAEAFKKIFANPALKTTDGSPDDLTLWKDAVSALNEDYQKLVIWADDQQKAIVKLRGQVARLSVICLFGAVLYGVTVWQASRYFNQDVADRDGEVTALQNELKAANDLSVTQKETLAALAARLAKVEQVQADTQPSTPTPTPAPAPTP
jgi:hypothetical protein